MSFKIRDLGVLAYAHGFTFWYYRTEDRTEDVQAPGYFADASDMLRLGDRITGSTSDRRVFDLAVTRNDARGVHTEMLGQTVERETA